jgi:hypothetical protein
VLIAVLAALAVTVAVYGTFRREATRTTGRNVGVLRITDSEPIPADLTGVRYLLLDANRLDRVAGVKQRYPGLRVLAYKNLSFLIDYSHDARGNAGVPWSQAPRTWFLRDRHGRRVRSAHFADSWLADVGLPAYQHAWRDDVLAFLRSAPWDGVFLDDALADPGWHLGGKYRRAGRYPTRKSFRAAERSMLAAVGPAITQAGYLAVANVVAGRGQADVWQDWAPFVSGLMLEHFLDGARPGEVAVGPEWQRETRALRTVEATRKSFLALSYSPPSTPAAQGYVRASFLLFDDPLTVSATIWHAKATPEAKLDVGAPKGPAVHEHGLWKRHFQHGTIVVDPRHGTYRVR